MPVEGNKNVIQADEEIMSKMIQIQNKRFYMDVKRNNRGKFIKIAQILMSGWKSRVFFSMSTAVEFLDRLKELNTIYDELKPFNVNKISNDGFIKSFSILKDSRRYFMDLMENERGRFLRIAMVRERPYESRNRSQISMTAHGIVELRNALSELVKSCMDKEDEEDAKLPTSKSFKAIGKIFYVDVTENFRGIFAIVSELKYGYRMSILLGVKFWGKFVDTLTQIDKQVAATEPGEELPAAHMIKAENKMFYFDVDANHRGIFLRISEVRSTYRTAITLPQETWLEFRDILKNMLEQVDQMKGKIPASSAGDD